MERERHSEREIEVKKENRRKGRKKKLWQLLFPGPKLREICKHSSFEPICYSTLDGTIISCLGKRNMCLPVQQRIGKSSPKVASCHFCFWLQSSRQDFKGSWSVAWVQKDWVKLPHSTLLFRQLYTKFSLPLDNSCFNFPHC